MKLTLLTKKIYLTVLVIIIAILFATTSYINKKNKKYRAEFTDRIELAISLLKNFGYGGMIHNFKNYLIRGDEKNFAEAVTNFSQIDFTIKVYENKSLTSQEKEALKVVYQTAKNYYHNLKLIKEEWKKAKGSSSIDIQKLDQKVKIDDSEALSLLSKLIASLNEKKMISEDSSNKSSNTFYTVIFIFALLIGLLYYIEIQSLHNTNENLKRANAELLQFSYRTSHDLKAPLTSIKGLSEFILEDLKNKDYPEVEKNISRIKIQSQKLEKLVMDILEIAKLDVATTEFETIDIQKQANDIKEHYKYQLQDRDVELKVQNNATRTHISSRVRLFQILSNLIGNAIKYSDPNKANRFVELSIEDNAKQLIIKIKDNGIGIPAKDKNEVYEMFKKFHSDNSTGSGLGMHIVMKSVLALKGEIDYDSSIEGTTFTLKIPTQKRG